MEHPIMGIETAFANCGRAYDHIDSLREEVGRFLSHKPYRIRFESNAKKTRHVAHVEFNRLPEPRMSVLVGEVVYNLRTALDHMVWLLTPIPAREGRDAHKIEFPIYANRLDKNGRRPYGGFHKEGARKIKGLPAPARRIIEGVQPYHRAKPSDRWLNPLLMLHELARIDRHRHLTILGGFAYAEWIGSHFEEGAILMKRDASVGQFDYGKEVATVFTRPGTNPKSNPDLERSITVTFSEKGPAGGLPVIPALTWIHAYVSGDVLRPLADTLRP